MEAMAHAGWQVAAGLILLIVGAAAGRLLTPQKVDCTKCGLTEIKTELQEEIRKLCRVIEVLSEKVGLTAKERLEIEALDRR